MNVAKTLSAFLMVLLAGCAGISSYSRMDTFQEGERSYRLALRDSDFKAAAHFKDPATMPESYDYDKYKKIQVVRYKTNKTILSSDQKEIRQEVEIQYYHQNRPVLKTLQDNQVWRFHDDKKVWLLQSALPEFE